jgi:hypothetical protein
VLKAGFSFNWQLGYEVEEPIRAPKGTRMVVVAHHDNSANNVLNPEPEKDVAWGERTNQEMMLPWFGVVVTGDATPDMIASYKPGDFDGPLPSLDNLLPPKPNAASGAGKPAPNIPEDRGFPTPKVDSSDLGFWTGRK